MAVNSLEFAFFLSFVLMLMFAVPSSSARWQNSVLLAANFAYYGLAGWWMVPFLALVVLFFYWLGILLGRVEDDRRAFRLLFLGVVAGLGGLAYFKYAAPLADVLAGFASLLGKSSDWPSVHIAAPLGISFFTFRLITKTAKDYSSRLALGMPFPP